MPQRRLLGKWHKSTLSTGFSRRLMIRVDVIMSAANGQTNYMIAKQLGISRNTVKLWRYRFVREGLPGLMTRPIPGRPPKRLQLEISQQVAMPVPPVRSTPIQAESEVAVLVGAGN